jgi:hypothetical protein
MGGPRLRVFSNDCARAGPGTGWLAPLRLRNFSLARGLLTYPVEFEITRADPAEPRWRGSSIGNGTQC